MAGAAFHTGSSSGEYATPPEFIAAVKRKFGVTEFDYDLAASPENTKAKHFFTEEEDSLKQEWPNYGDLWLNPPYAKIAPWAEKCARYCFRQKIRIFFLVPAAVGSNWWRDHVHNKAKVRFLNGRISFDGKAPYPKDCALCVYGIEPGYEVWSWKKGVPCTRP